MSTMARSRAYRRAELFYRVIERHVSAAFSISIPRDDLDAAVAEFNWPEWVVDQDRMTNPYYFAFRCVQEGLARVLRPFNLKGPVQFTFDSHTSGPLCLDHWDLLKASCTPEIASTFAGQPLFRKEEEQLPLQAADLYAFWVRKWKQSGDREAMKHLAFPWTADRDIPRFRLDLRQGGLLRRVANCQRNSCIATGGRPKCIADRSGISKAHDARRLVDDLLSPKV